ncbi:carbohydrate ABC transporter permease [Nocardiopsis baichengensis]|uniref:carbohydrate ABC transporter permease n=1 Tax=Nocardiopsis baichengensis TaxID=280240 RepID=UPI0003457F91|nr:sugar ABC transporter permease [Nocardiopsis baichengensis]
MRAAPPHRARPAPASGGGPTPWMAAPALVLFGLFALVPLAGVAVLSFASWDGLGAPRWAGADNWARAAGDPVTREAVWLTVKLTVLCYLFQAPVSLLLGVYTATRTRHREVLAVLYFLPLLFSSAAVALTFKGLLDPNFGLGAALDLPLLARDWLGDPDLALGVVVFVVGWSFIPFHALLYQGGVRQIPASLYEAARIDGASAPAQFLHITLPQLKYTIVTSSTLMLVGSLTYFDLVFVLTAGGPGGATRILPLDMYLTGFRSYDMGQASAIGVVLVAVGLALALGLNRLTGSHRMESRQEGA